MVDAAVRARAFASSDSSPSQPPEEEARRARASFELCGFLEAVPSPGASGWRLTQVGQERLLPLWRL
eukprot:2187337-Alexandrium_andersonii.AAC.1